MTCDKCDKQTKPVFEETDTATAANSGSVFAKGGGDSPACPDCGTYNKSGSCPQCDLANSLSERGGDDSNAATTSFTKVDGGGGSLQRCRSCGRFASMNKAHVCPVTSDPTALAGALSRRIGGDANQLYGEERIADLFDEAAESDNNTVYMMHPYSYMPQEVELDAVPILMQAGYVPEMWMDDLQHRVLGKNGRVYSVCDTDDQLSSVPIPETAVGQAAQAYGLAIDDDTPVMSASSLGDLDFAGAYFPQYTVRDDNTPMLPIGGEEWDASKMTRNEFGSRASKGSAAWEGSSYTVGQRVRDADAQSPFRERRATAVVVGKTLPKAAYGLIENEMLPVITPSGNVEVWGQEFDENGKRVANELLATYDPAGRTLSTNEDVGEADMTAAQALAHSWSAARQNIGYLEQARDGGSGGELALADSMYLSMKEDMETNGTVFVGGHMANAQKCPDCGRFTGEAAHVCPSKSGNATPSSSPAPATADAVDAAVDAVMGAIQRGEVNQHTAIAEMNSVMLEKGHDGDVAELAAQLLEERIAEEDDDGSRDLASTATIVNDLLGAVKEREEEEVAQATLQQATLQTLAREQKITDIVQKVIDGGGLENEGNDSTLGTARDLMDGNLYPATENQDGTIEVWKPVMDDSDNVIGNELAAIYHPDSRTVEMTGQTDSDGKATGAGLLAVAYSLSDSRFREAMEQSFSSSDDYLSSVGGSVPGSVSRIDHAARLASAMSGEMLADTSINGEFTFDFSGNTPSKCPDCGRFTGQAAHVCPSKGDGSSNAAPSVTDKVKAWATENLADTGFVSAEDADEIHAKIYSAVISAMSGTSVEDAGNQLEARLTAGGFSTDAVELARHAYLDLAEYNEIGELSPRLTRLANQNNPNAPTPPSREDKENEAKKGEDNDDTKSPAPVLPVTTTAKEVRPGAREVTPDGYLSAQEQICKDVYLPAPDPWLANVPGSFGGQLEGGLNEIVPSINPSYVLDEGAKEILASMSASLQLSQAVDPKHGNKLRSFGLYGPAGTGKNELARQLAASIKTVEVDGSIRQGIHYQETTVTPEMTAEEIIGSATLVSINGATQSQIALGPIGKAAAMGGVIAVNEIARNPKLASSFQSMIEDGVIEINSPEAGTVRIPVHPATTFVFTWNPGYEGDADRPGQAPLSRMGTYRMETPKTEDVLYQSSILMQQIGFEVDDMPAPASVRLRDSYKIPLPSENRVTAEELEKAVGFWEDMQKFTTPTSDEMAEVGGMSTTPTTPGRRELSRFLLLGKAVGWHDAAQIFQVCCDQGEDFDEQWKLVTERFSHYYGRKR